MAATRWRDLPQFQDQRRRDALPPVRCRDRQIVDVDLAALLLELVQLIRREAAHDLAPLQGGEGDEVVAAEQALEIGGAGPGPAIGLHLAEGLAEGRQHGLHQCDVGGREQAYIERGRRRHGRD
jgi:hypothetical protein